MIIELCISSVILFIMWVVFANTKKFIGKQYSPVIQALAHLWGFLFGTVDVIYNITFGSLIFLQLPRWKQFTLTARLRAILVSSDTGWRFKLALFVCTKLVEPWDYNHCGVSE